MVTESQLRALVVTALFVMATWTGVGTAATVQLSQFSSDSTPAALLAATVTFTEGGGTLTIDVINNTDTDSLDGNLTTFNIVDVYFNDDTDPGLGSALSLTSSPGDAW